MSEFQSDFSYGESSSASAGLQKFFFKVFAWMFFGLLTTAAVGYGLFFTSVTFLQGLMQYYIVIVGAELVLVWYLSSRVMNLSPTTARLLFLLYAAMNGVMVTMLTMIYGSYTIVVAFGLSCVFFGAMAFIGATTKSDLTKMGPMLMAGLIAIIVLSIVNIFLRLDGLDFILCIVGLGLFFALTAYDMNKLKRTYYAVVQDNPGVSDSVAIIGALTLYLDFINIFVRIVRLLGRNR